MWAALANTLLGIWLMASPAVLGYGSPAATNDHIIGPIVATFAAIAAWQVTRPLRWVNLPLGLWQILAPMVLGYEALAATLNSFAVGAAIALLSAVQGRQAMRFGGGWLSLWRTERLAEESDREQPAERALETGRSQ